MALVGIDLGTANSLIAVFGEGGPDLIPNALGEVLTLSVVGVDEAGEILVGKAALTYLSIGERHRKDRQHDHGHPKGDVLGTLDYVAAHALIPFADTVRLPAH
ncbi:Hsp70 family protein [Chelativorans sp. M5D2P16]|uniref:Hsp70 family protein n=1 Tax=Chelativorans sp. M5D2P16 TaxID=3095678 RepID=UPI002ACA47F3|nr:Hsp70 family protein [Chelativorans sp. M5D2P16]MDZ5698724.1 Hsp70 family protein [Chelativorans sp. M5D2P16]